MSASHVRDPWRESMLRNPNVITALVLVAPFAVACGSSDKQSSSSSNTPQYNVNNDTITATGNPDGGDTTITTDQVTAIKSSACAGWNGELEGSPAKLQLVVDISSSMSQTAPGTNQSKWAVTQNALIQAIPGDGTTTAGLAASTSVGLLFYPNKQSTPTVAQQDLSACLDTGAMIPMAQLGASGTGSQRDLIRQSFQSAVLAQGTPTYDAYTYALNNSTLSASAAMLPGAPYQLLITDGQPTIAQGCSNPNGNISNVDPEPIVTAITNAWTQEGVKTFVIGSPGSEGAVDWLSRAAVAGQTALAGCNVGGPNYCHMDMTTAPDFSAALSAGLAQVTAQIASCTYTLPVAPNGQALDLTMINVIATLSTGIHLLMQDTAGDCTVGWQFDADNNIKLCSQTCAMVQADPTATIDVAVACADAINLIVN
jgi:hypothetical protein